MAIPKVRSVQAFPNKTLLVVFDGRESRLFDVSPYLSSPAFSRLGDFDYLRQVRVIMNGYAVAWPDDEDLSKDTLYLEGRKPSIFGQVRRIRDAIVKAVRADRKQPTA